MRRIGLVLWMLGCSGATVGPLTGDGGDAAANDAASADVATEAQPQTVPITLGTCPAFTGCGGDVVATWALSGGCLADPLAQSKQLCPTLVVNSETADGSGTVTFAGNVVTRSYQAQWAMDITVPTACLLGATCTQLQADYQVYIPNTTCTTVTAGCQCTGSLTSAANETSTYTTSNNQIIVASGDHYAYCVNGASMQYEHISGPTQELGTYTLTKN